LIVLFIKYYSGEQIKNTGMGRACSTHGERISAYMVLVEKMRDRDYLEGPGVDGRIILKWIFKMWNGRP